MRPIKNKVTIAIISLVAFYSNYSFAQANNPLINSGEVIKTGTQLHDDKKYKQAIAEYMKVDRSDTNYLNAVYELSYSYYSDSQFVKSIEYAELGMKNFPEKYSQYSMQAANSYDDMGKSEEALKLYDDALKKNPQDYLTHFNRGVVNFKLKKYDEAKNDLQRCLMINPFYSSAHYFLGKVYLLRGNLVASLLALKTYLLIAPGGKYYINTITAMSGIAKVTDEVLELVKEKQKSKEDNFDEQQEILLSKIALDRKYKLKADLEDNIVRQIQVVDEKLEYNRADKGFAMQFYVPFYSATIKEGDFEPMIFLIFSGIQSKEIDSWNKKNKKEHEAFITKASSYLENIKRTQVLDPTQRENSDMNFIYSNQVLIGKGNYTKDKDPHTVGKWEFYHPNGAFKAIGSFTDKGEKDGPWTYYYSNGQVKEKSIVSKDEINGLVEGWFENGNKWYTETYKNGKLDGVQTIYYFNEKLKSIINYKDGVKNGESKYFDFKGRLTSTENFANDISEGQSRSYYPNGKLKNEYVNKAGKTEGTYKSYYQSGKIYMQGEFKNDLRQGLWTSWYEDGTVEGKTTYLDNEITGEFTEFHPNGKLSHKGTYYKKKIDGKEENYDDDGKIYEDAVYDKGRLKEINFYDKTGKTIFTTTTRKGAAEITFYSAEGIKTGQGYFNKDGDKDGKYVTYYASGKISEESNWKSGVKEGPSTSYYPNGQIKQTTNYTNNEEDGYVKYYYANGKLSSEGWKVEGQRQQKYIYYNQVGDITTKEYFLDDDLNGYNEYFEPHNIPSSESHYEHGWIVSVTQFDTTGKVLSENKFEKGKGPLFYKNLNGKNSAVGTYENYLLNGPYTFYFFDGSVAATSFYKNDQRDSTYKSYYFGGKLRTEGKYRTGDKIGKWKYYYANGKLREEENYDEDGDLEGEDKIYLTDGTLDKLLTYKNGELNGPLDMYGDKNEIAIRLIYKSNVVKAYQYEEKPGVMCAEIPLKAGTGKVAGKYPNGKQSVLFTFNESNLEGERKMFYSNGKICSEGNRFYGFSDGLCKTYYSNGNIWEEENYVLGNLHGLSKTYYANGKLEKEENYYNDELHGVCKYYDELGKLKQTYTYYYGSLLSVK